jgi:hypothetical protein
VERYNPAKGQAILGQRVAGSGKTIYRVRPTDDELTIEINKARSKGMRNCVVRLMPRDLLQECKQAIMGVRKGSYQQKLPDARKRCADEYAEAGIPVADLATVLGKPLDEATLDDLVDLRTLLDSVQDGEVAWATVMAKYGDGRPEAMTGKLAMDDLQAGDQEDFQDIRNNGGTEPGAPISDDEIPQEDGKPAQPPEGDGRGAPAATEGGPQTSEDDGTLSDTDAQDPDTGAAQEAGDVPDNILVRLDHLMTVHPMLFKAVCISNGVPFDQLEDLADIPPDKRVPIYQQVKAKAKGK